MTAIKPFESHRRTIVKSLIWRFIGIFWTWGGAFVIISFLPDSQKNAPVIATLVTAWHHSTRMLMYYAYERIWIKVSWGRLGQKDKSTTKPLKLRQQIIWTSGVILSVSLIFWLLLAVTPDIKKAQKNAIQQKNSLSMSTTQDNQS
ncbi:MAG: DUF2061 domain-containing protein [Desulfuromonadales bacterium]|nr:DUF2061 domain-containing protein [Desulfuromonadales bacterium]